MTNHDTLEGPRIGELFAGYGGLGLGVQQVFGGTVVWYSDVCKFDKDGNAGHYEPHRAPCSILAHRIPDATPLGDVTRVDWSTVEPVDILTGGSPCQDLSQAGKRKGMTEGTRSNLWVAMREAIAQLRPRLVIWENVRGAYSSAADSELVTRPGLLAGVRRRDGQPVLRALGRVLGDLSELGYDASWHGLRAADVGAPHGRFRVFVVARDSRGGRGYEAVEHDGRGTSPGDWRGVPDQPDRDALRTGPYGARLLKTPTSQLAVNGGSQHPDKRRSGGHGPTLADEVEHLLPTPSAASPDSRRCDLDGRTYSADGYQRQQLGDVAHLLQTPSSVDSLGGHERRGGTRRDELLLNGQAKAMHDGRWGDYGPAIARWESALGRPVPDPTVTSIKGNPQLSPAFVEWMMGLPAGWVTDVPGITRNEALKALGNGVVPQQAAAAIRVMLSWDSTGVAS